MPARSRARFAVVLAAAALAGAGVAACGSNRSAGSESNQGAKGGGPQAPNPGGLVSTGTPQPTVTQPERPLTVPASTSTAPVAQPPVGGP